MLTGPAIAIANSSDGLWASRSISATPPMGRRVMLRVWIPLRAAMVA